MLGCPVFYEPILAQAYYSHFKKISQNTYLNCNHLLDNDVDCNSQEKFPLVFMERSPRSTFTFVKSNEQNSSLFQYLRL